jgi:hypothetical protein
VKSAQIFLVDFVCPNTEAVLEAKKVRSLIDLLYLTLNPIECQTVDELYTVYMDKYEN